jgi:hypothetical protein
MAAGILTNTVEVTSDQFDPNPESNMAVENTTVNSAAQRNNTRSA